MYFESYKFILFADTHLPDIFLSEYLPSLDGDTVKVYLYCLFLSKYKKQASAEELSKKLSLDLSKVKDALISLESIGVINRKENSIVLVDLKEKEINKLYRIKNTSTPEEALQNSESNKKRNAIISAINNSFFQGLMSPSWYTDIDAWFDIYKFEEDVMYSLFQHCYDHNGLSPKYVHKVAQSWHSKNIRDNFDLDKYFMSYQKVKDIKSCIAKKLKLSRNLTEYEQEYIEKWVMEYKYDFEIIELALKKTTSKTNPNFEYINAILTDWHKNGLHTKEAVYAYTTLKKAQTPVKPKEIKSAIPQKGNFEQRDYDEEYYRSLYENLEN